MTAVADTAAALTAIGAGRGSDPSLLVDEYLWYVRDAIANHPRSLQRRIGPSEVGHPCERRIGYLLAGAEPNHVRPADVPWLPTVGTAVHGWLEHVFSGPKTLGRFLVETKVSVGEIGGVDITGHADLYDTVTATVIDHKIVGANTRRKYKAHGPGQQYRGQAHLYGRGFVRAGYPVDRVMIAFLPRNDELTDAHFWSEPYDEAVALAALQRANGVQIVLDALGRDNGLRALPTADAYCHRCSFFLASSNDPAVRCPGHPGRAAEPIGITPPQGPAFGPVQERLISA